MRSMAIGVIGVIVIIAAGLSIFLATKSDGQSNPSSSVDETLACSSDGDCVPASCCHSKSVVNKDFAPDCSGVVCTAVCEPDTLDCGQGKPACRVGRCGVVKSEQKR